MQPSSAAVWSRRNVVCAGVFGAVLVLAGVLGLVGPDAGLMSVAVPYDVFHIAFGFVGLGAALSGRPPRAALFNLGFGLVDLYQAVAGLLGLFPAQLFALRPADHVAHVVFGLALVAIGTRGRDRVRASVS
jgi:hypothetical protein